MIRRERTTFWHDFKTFFARGLAILLPSVLTLWLLVQGYRFVETNVAEPINAGIRQVVILSAPRIFEQEELPAWFTVDETRVQRRLERREAEGRREILPETARNQVRQENLAEYWDDHWYLRLIGLFVAIVLIYLAGVLLGGFIGRRIYSRIERLLARVPIFKQVYPHVKQVVDFLFGQGQSPRENFKRVVLVEYPRRGIWTIGLMTGSSLGEIHEVADSECVAIFIPSSPTPFTGYTITVPKNEVIEMPLTIEEALRFVVSGGVLVPERDRPDPGSVTAQLEKARQESEQSDRSREAESA